MKRVLNFWSLLLILSLAGISCGKDPQMEKQGGDAGTGRFSLKLQTLGSFELVTSKAAEVSINDFVVRIKGTTLKNTVLDSVWQRYADMPSIVTIPAGTYKIEAYNGKQRTGFDTPYYYGSREFTVGIQELTDAQVVCKLACVKVTVEFTDLFESNVGDGLCLVHNVNGDVLQFSKTENGMAGYIAVPSDSSLVVTVRGKYLEDQTELGQTYYIKKVEPAQWHKITLSVNTMAGVTTDGMLTIDHNVQQKDTTVMVPGGNDIIDNNGDPGNWDENEPTDPEKPEEPGEDSKNVPEVAGVDFDIDQLLPVLLPEDENETVKVDVSMKVLEGIDSLVVTIDSKALTDEVLGMVSLAKTFDIANVSSLEREEMLKELGMIKEGDPIKGKTSHVFSVGGFMPMLALVQQEPTEVHKFYLRVVDKKKNVTVKVLTIELTK